MKKTTKFIIGILLILTMLVAFVPKTYAMDVTLEEVAKRFNESTIVDSYEQNAGVVLYATYDKGNSDTTNGQELRDPSITINVGYMYDLKYTLKGNILTGNYSGGNTVVLNYWIDVSKLVIDTMETILGSKSGEMLETLNSSQIGKYTLENEGLLLQNDYPNSYSVEIDITKRIPTLDFNTYIKVEDLEEVKDQLSGDERVERFEKGKVLFRKDTINDKDILIVGEQDEFTYRINKSIPSILSVMLGSDEAVEYFKENYPSVDKNKLFDGFKIEVNPIKNATEQFTFSDTRYQFVRITIDREAIKTALEERKGKTPIAEDPGTGTPIKEDPGTGTPVTGTPETGSGGSGNSGTLPKTGAYTNLVLYGLYVIVLFGGIALISISTNKKRKQK